jgi:valyl-tRNA synthetase
MPPPNITGKLHMGHALFLTIQDSLNRYWKNLKHNSLWIPGLDHVGLATYDKILAYQKESELGYEESSSFIASTHRDIIPCINLKNFTQRS